MWRDLEQLLIAQQQSDGETFFHNTRLPFHSFVPLCNFIVAFIVGSHRPLSVADLSDKQKSSENVEILVLFQQR